MSLSAWLTACAGARQARARSTHSRRHSRGFCRRRESVNRACALGWCTVLRSVLLAEIPRGNARWRSRQYGCCNRTPAAPSTAGVSGARHPPPRRPIRWFTSCGRDCHPWTWTWTGPGSVGSDAHWILHSHGSSRWSECYCAGCLLAWPACLQVSITHSLTHSLTAQCAWHACMHVRVMDNSMVPAHARDHRLAICNSTYLHLTFAAYDDMVSFSRYVYIVTNVNWHPSRDGSRVSRG